jgi:WD40 repeat protein/transcriptional regulator with XRE-family HTH domain
MSTTISSISLEKFTTFGDLLRFLRRRAGLTQLELSIAVGYSDAQISRLEQNLRLPDLSTIEALFIPALYLEDEPKAAARLWELAANARSEDSPDPGICPYKGLNYFDEEDAHLFVGRETLTKKILERVLSLSVNDQEVQHRFLAIVGASGSGKSSLVRAGLVPALRKNTVSTDWTIHLLTPTSHPLESLAAELTKESDSVATTATLMDDLRQEPRSLNLFINRKLNSTVGSHHLLVVDQFEEIFTLCRSEELRIAFIDNLLMAASAIDGKVIIVIALRADFYVYCARYPILRETIAKHQEFIGSMSEGELRRAIEEPARKNRWDFEPGLVDLLLHDVGQEPGALPLLSHALLETWQRRRKRTMTLIGYTLTGGVHSAIAETAEAVFTDQLSSQEQVIARRIFLRLIQLGDETSTGFMRRRATSDELYLNQEEETATKSVLKKLADARLIIAGAQSIEVAHEALIREWPRLRGWLEDNREDLVLHRHLTEAATEWMRFNREPGGLYRGARLKLAHEWAENHADEMSPLEHEFLEASLNWAEREAAEKEMLHQRELESAQKLLEAERQRADLEMKRAEEQAQTSKQLRKRAIFLSGALIITLLMAFVSLFLSDHARQSMILAQHQQRVAYAGRLALAALSKLDEDPELSILLATHAVLVTYSVDNTWTAEAENALRRALDESRVELTLRGHTGKVWSVAFSPACELNQIQPVQLCILATVSDDGTLRAWNPFNGEALFSYPTNATRGYHGLSFSPDSRQLVTAGEIGTAIVLDLATQEEKVLFGHTDWVYSVRFSPDGRWIATSSKDWTVTIWDADTGQEITSLIGHNGAVSNVAFSPDSMYIATASEDGRVIIWDTSTWKELKKLSGHLGAVNGVVFSLDGTLLATASDDRTVKVWNVEAGEEIITMAGHTDKVWNLAFSSDGKLLASSGFDNKVKVWDPSSGLELFNLVGHKGPVTGLDFGFHCREISEILVRECGTRLATASWDGTVKVWNSSLRNDFINLFSPGASVVNFSSSDKSILAVGYFDGSIQTIDMSNVLEKDNAGQVVDVKIGNGFYSLSGHESPVLGVGISLNLTQLAASFSNGIVKVWDYVTGMELITLDDHTAGVYVLIFSPDGKNLLTVGYDYKVMIHDLSKRESQPNLYYMNEWDKAFAFSPDGSILAHGTKDGSVKVVDIETGLEVVVISGHTDAIVSINFSPDGRYLATSSEDRTVIVWDTEDYQKLSTLPRMPGVVDIVRFNQAGTKLATASQEGIVKVWDLATELDEISLDSHTSRIADIGFSSNDTQLITVNYDGMIRQTPLHIEDLVTLAFERVTRELTNTECQQYFHLLPEQCPEDNEILLIDENELVNQSNELLGITHRKVCQITDVAGLYDRQFNQIAYKGLKEAGRQFGWDTIVFESNQTSDYHSNILQAIQNSCDLIVMSSGFSYGDLTRTFAEAYPDQKFQIFNYFSDQLLDNLWGQGYYTDQVAFLSGYVAASVTTTGKLGTFGAMHMPIVTQFMDGFTIGVKYYNEKYNKEVKVLGWDEYEQIGLFIGDFDDFESAMGLAEELINDGADVIFPVAGKASIGAAVAANEFDAVYIIGVDTDWVEIYPEFTDIILTSIELRLDVNVVEAVKSIVEGTFVGGMYIGTMENGGVSLASFHQLDYLVSPQIKEDLVELKAGIISGEIKTKP